MRFSLNRSQTFIFMAMSLAVVLITISSCKDQSPLSPYYFPSEHQVYVYSANDSIGKEYWEISPHDRGLSTHVYGGDFRKSQESRESFYSNGVNLEELTLISNNNAHQATVESGFVFPYEEIDSSEVVFYRIKWNVNNGTHTTRYELVRNRRFAGYENHEFMGTSELCAKFILDELIISDLDGSIELKTRGVEYYAKNIGLVYRKRQMTEELLIEQRLLEVISIDEFKRRQEG